MGRGRSRRATGPARVRQTGALPAEPVTTSTGSVQLVPDRDQPRAMTLLVNGVPSSHIDLDDPGRLDFEYMQQMSTVIDHLPAGPLHVLHLGAGACTMPRWVEASRPGSRQLAVDLDATLVTLVREWFDLPRAPRLRIRAGEAREVLQTLPDARFDVVVRDVFAGSSTPSHLSTASFLREVRRVLRPDGLYLANCADSPPLDLARSEVATAREVFSDVALAAEPGQLKGRRYGNLVLMGAVGGSPDLGAAALARGLRSLPVPVRLLHGPELTDFAGTAAPLQDPAPA